MKLFSSTTRISFSLACLTVTAMFSAMLLGIFPDQRTETLIARGHLTESIAVNFSAVSQNVNLKAMGSALADLISRNPELQSIGIRRPDGKYLIEAGEHHERWQTGEPESLVDTQMQFPLYSSGELWGTVEARFTPVNAVWFGRFAPSRKLQFVSFVGFVSLFLFNMFLRKALQQLNPSRAVPRRVHEALDALAEGLLILDETGRIVLCNSAFASAVTRPREELIGQPIGQFHWSHKAGSPFPWELALSNGETITSVLIRSAETNDRTFSVSAVPIRDDRDVVRGSMVSFEDVTVLEKNKAELVGMLDELRLSRDEIRDQNEELERLATVDPLTGCLNRRAFFGRFELHWKMAEKHNQPLSCIIVDVDHFKSVNDTFGHGTGDEVLSAVGRLLSSLAQNQECVCRYGGEEFCFLLPGISLDDATARAEHVRLSIIGLRFEQLSITASLGVSSRDQGAVGPLLMLEQSDKCLYAAKRNGRNQVVRFDRMPTVVETESAVAAVSKSIHETDQSPVPFEAVSALLAALSFRDQATADHSRRVADLCVKVGESLLSKAECYTLEMAALLHDIGKVGVPDAILLKSGELTAEEWSVMDKHEHFGVEIVRKAFASRQLASIIQNHRAHYNGSARNESLPAGVSIPVGARLLAIADAFDAMTMNRVFRKGRSQDEAFNELRRCAGTQFDPELVERFVEAIQSTPSLVAGRSDDQIEAAGVLQDLNELAESLSERDFDRVATITEHMKQSATRLGAVGLLTKAQKLQTAVLSDSDLLDVLHMARELTEECLSASGIASAQKSSEGTAGESTSRFNA